MNVEIEAKFLNVNHEEVREKLKALGAVQEYPMRLMRRAIIQNAATGRDGYIRLRDEGERVTLTHKHFTAQRIDGAQEVEVTVGNFTDTLLILEAAGLSVKSFQESRRETWHLGDVEIVLDEWPWLKPYIEIEGPSVEAVASTAEKLGFNMAGAVYGGVMAAYRAEYPHLGVRSTVGNLPEVKFGDPVPEMLRH